ncbi:MAG TPA: nucleotidyl transferase AbiEii/AbiGii toxin family protein [Candidatus Nanoarchaeia archaeon]|nr:nucleotidyl transferase AbiEii/AbiGii toxin family protein [Candidatus Nanoarchaeia archaeon]
MITKNELQRYRSLTGFNMWQVERDYLQHLFLILLSRHSTSELVFKGGTALQKAYGLDRFSIDLDFTQREKIDFSGLMDKLTAAITDFGYQSVYEEIKTIGKAFRLKIQGPLYANTPISISTLTVEVSQRENILLGPKMVQITPVYRDLQPYTIVVMHEEEILAEKIRAIIARNKPRDVFDLNFMLNRGVKMNIEFINKKLEYYKQGFNKKVLIENIKKKEPIWEKEMKNYIASLPDFKTILANIEEKLKLV